MLVRRIRLVVILHIKVLGIIPPRNENSLLMSLIDVRMITRVSAKMGTTVAMFMLGELVRCTANLDPVRLSHNASIDTPIQFVLNGKTMAHADTGMNADISIHKI